MAARPISPIIDWKAASADVSSRLERKCGMANQDAESLGGNAPMASIGQIAKAIQCSQRDDHLFSPSRHN